MENVSLKKEVGKFLRLFFILYLIVFVVLNITGWLIRPKPLEVPSGQNGADQKEQLEEEPQSPQCVFSEKPDSISIPRIGIEAPIVFPEDEAKEVLAKALDIGVVHYPSSVLPGEEGQVILLGHSAPAGWPMIKYDWVFSNLKELKEDDEIFVIFKNCQYAYRVTNKIFLEKGEELPSDLTNSENMLILISCWPPGKDIRRIAVKALYDETLGENN
jgi:LPXTG-site transpeptidase (sortase) family protein